MNFHVRWWLPGAGSLLLVAGVNGACGGPSMPAAEPEPDDRWANRYESPVTGASRPPDAGLQAAPPVAEVAPVAPPRAPPKCTVDARGVVDFEVPEASSAAEVELISGVPELLVVGDSGNHGRALAINLANRSTRVLTLPIDPLVSDDIEGMAWRAGSLYLLTSNGYVEHFLPDGKGGATRDGLAYPLDTPFGCLAPKLNDPSCGKNYEGLCLRGGASWVHHCAGYVASKTDGWLGCVVFEGERLTLDASHAAVPLRVAKNSLSDCAFGAADGPAEDVLLVTTNVYNGSQSYRVDEDTFAVSPLGVGGLLNNEAIAVDHQGALYQFMDTNGKSSGGTRATCSGW